MAYQYPSPTVAQFANLIEKYSAKYKVPVEIIANTIFRESSGNPRAWNPSNGENSRGLMQISEATAKSTLKVTDLEKLWEPEYNIERGTWYLSYIYGKLLPIMGTMTPADRWMVVTSSYNQGSWYWQNAIETLMNEGKALTFPTIQNRVLNPINTTRTPWRDNVLNYAAKIFSKVSSLEISGSTAVGIGVGVLVVGAALTWYYVTSTGKTA